MGPSILSSLALLVIFALTACRLSLQLKVLSSISWLRTKWVTVGLNDLLTHGKLLSICTVTTATFAMMTSPLLLLNSFITCVAITCPILVLSLFLPSLALAKMLREKLEGEEEVAPSVGDKDSQDGVARTLSKKQSKQKIGEAKKAKTTGSDQGERASVSAAAASPGPAAAASSAASGPASAQPKLQ